MYINIGNRCVVQFDSAICSLATEFNYHLQEDNGGLPIVGNVDVDNHISLPPNAIMLIDNRLFTLDGTLYILEGSSCYQLHITEQQFSIIAKGNDSARVLPLLVQTMLNFYMPRYGLMFLHTAACKLGHEVIAISAFGGAGKTETMIEMLKEGAIYLSDDLAIFDIEGCIHPYLRRISLHGYPFTDEQLTKYELSRWRYHLMNYCKGETDRIRKYLYQRLRGRFNITLDYTMFTDGKVTPFNHTYCVNHHYWLDSCNTTGLKYIEKECFIRNMSFCMRNEFRPYIDFDGYCSLIYPCWKVIRQQYDSVLQTVLEMIEIKGLSICGQDYRGLARLIIESTKMK